MLTWNHGLSLFINKTLYLSYFSFASEDARL